MIRSTAPGARAHMLGRAISLVTTWLPMAGIVGPLQFTLVYLWQGATRPGYDAIPMMVSALSLTSRGLIDIVSLVLNGLLLIAFAIGLRRALRPRSATWGSVLLGVAGFGFVVAGVFVTDPAQGYPAGTPAGPAVTTSVHGLIHFAVGATCVIGGLTAGAVVFARFFWNDPAWRGWSLYSIVTAIAVLACSVGFAYAGLHRGPAGLLERIAFSAGLLWVVALATTLLRRQSARAEPGAAP